MPQCRHRCVGRVRKRRQRTSEGNRAQIVRRIGSRRNVIGGAVARGQTPGIGAVSFVMLRVGDAVGAIDQRDVAVVVEVRRGVAIVQLVRIERQERVMGKEQRSAAAHRSEGTRLNSSHVENSYAVFCLKKKKQKKINISYIVMTV